MRTGPPQHSRVTSFFVTKVSGMSQITPSKMLWESTFDTKLETLEVKKSNMVLSRFFGLAEYL